MRLEAEQLQREPGWYFAQSSCTPTKSSVKKKSLRMVLRKNIHVGVELYAASPTVCA